MTGHQAAFESMEGSPLGMQVVSELAVVSSVWTGMGITTVDTDNLDDIGIEVSSLDVMNARNPRIQEFAGELCTLISSEIALLYNQPPNPDGHLRGGMLPVLFKVGWTGIKKSRSNGSSQVGGMAFSYIPISLNYIDPSEKRLKTPL